MTLRTNSSAKFLAGSLLASAVALLVMPLLGYVVLAASAITAWGTRQARWVRWVLTALAVVLIASLFAGWAVDVSGSGEAGQPGPPTPRP